MQFPRYEFMLPPPAPPRRPVLEPQPRPRRVRPPRRTPGGWRLARAVRGPRLAEPTRLEVQEYLALEFSVEKRR